MTWRSGQVVSLGRAWNGAQELAVAVAGSGTVRALAYPELVGVPAPGDEVVLNTTALDRGLGTGGYALVITVRPGDGSDADGALHAAGGQPGDAGHLVKARYTPLQTMVLGVDEQESPHHRVLREADDLGGMPVIVADLHSAVPAIIAGARHAAELAGAPAPRIAYVMTDGGALPAWFSRTISGLRDAGWLASCISAGQAFGGDLEAVTVHSGLLAAHHVVGADVTIVAQGPGNLGTGTMWGFSGVAAGEAVNAAGTLGGWPIASLRVSGADERERHRGISHHSLTAYGRVALVPSDVVVPVLADAAEAFEPSGQDPSRLGGRIREQADVLSSCRAGHRLVEVAADTGVVEALRSSPVGLSTMGRGFEADPAAFLAAAVAGVHAVTPHR
jgi:Protein of unknown function (DUF3866)